MNNIKLGLFLELATGMKMWGENSHQFDIDVIQNPHVDKLEKRIIQNKNFNLETTFGIVL